MQLEAATICNIPALSTSDHAPPYLPITNSIFGREGKGRVVRPCFHLPTKLLYPHPFSQ